MVDHTVVDGDEVFGRKVKIMREGSWVIEPLTGAKTYLVSGAVVGDKNIYTTIRSRDMLEDIVVRAPK